MRFAAALGASFVAGVAATAWVALTLAEFGHFAAALPLLAFPAASAGTFFLLTRGKGAGTSPAVAPQDALAVGIACASLFLSLPPDEILVGGQDPGVYVHTASVMARTGSLLIEEPDISAYTAEERALVSRDFAGIKVPFPGVWSFPDGRLSFQFYHLYPSLMAVAWSVGGLRAALLVNPLLNVAAILALYAVASLLLGRRWALAAALVHALATAQIRQAKIPTAEMMAQFFLLAGVALLAVSTRGDDPPRALAPLAGMSLGMAILTRSDAIIFVVPLLAVLLLAVGPGRAIRPVLAALGTASLFFVHSWLHQRYITPYYDPLAEVTGTFLLAAATLVSLLLLARRTRAWRRVADLVPSRGAAVRAAAAGFLVFWVMFGWFVRPRLAGDGRVGHFFRLISGYPPLSGFAHTLAGGESRNMLYLVDLLGAAGLLLSVAGIAALVVSRRQPWESAWLAASVAMMVAVTYNVHHDHFLMWVSRRFVPAVVPLTSIGVAAAAAFTAGGRRGRSPVLAGAGLALVGTTLALNFGATRAMAGEREWPGLIAWYERLEKSVPAEALLYSDQPGFAAPLRFISGRRAYELSARSPERVGSLVTLMRRKASEGREVLYLSQQSFDDPRAIGLDPVGSHPLRSSMLATSRRGIPTTSKARGADFVLYRVQPSEGGTASR